MDMSERACYLSFPHDAPSVAVAERLRNILESQGIRVLPPVDDGSRSTLTPFYWLRLADVVVLDMTGDSSWVAYEAGAAKALNRTLLPVAQPSGAITHRPAGAPDPGLRAQPDLGARRLRQGRAGARPLRQVVNVLTTRCFVIMPYREELHFMYLFVKAALEREFPGLMCERADKQAMTGLLKDKIERSINGADVVIADCTGSNPNVFYELGMAHALGKKTILLTADTAERAPTDIRAYEFIPYRLDDERNLLEGLTQALHSILGSAADDYELAKQLLEDYSAETAARFTPVTRQEFERRIEGKLKPGGNAADRARVVLPEVIDERLTIRDARAMGDWIDGRFPPEGTAPEKVPAERRGRPDG